ALPLLGAGPAEGSPIEPGRADAVLEKFGFDELRAAVVGAAPCLPQVIEFWRALGVDLIEVYGMDEWPALATAGDAGRVPAASAGTPIDDVELRIGDKGEVLIRGPIVMRGYRNNPEATSAAIDADGWLHTGDVGSLDDQGNLRIVDRLKEIIINAS